MRHSILKGLAPAAIAILSVGLAGCDVKVNIGESDGVPLAELDMSGDAPTNIALVGPDAVVVSVGSSLAIDVEGDDAAINDLRFSLDGDTLAISRESESWSDDNVATVRVTMPAPGSIDIIGSGKLETPSMESDADVTIVGSGSATIASLTADTLDITIPGSGQVIASGTAKKLDMTIPGSGNAKLADLKVDNADVTIIGSGNAEFASDGTVDASFVGSGNVTVTGNATCSQSAVGSGMLRCDKPTNSSEE